MTPAAPLSIAASASACMAAKPGAETPTTTGSDVRPVTRATTASDSSCVSLPASPIMPRMVRPVAPLST